MPAEQIGSAYKTSGGFGIRWYDEQGTRRRRAGFASRSAARAWFRDVEQPRMRGEAVARPPVTLQEHAGRYLDVHATTADPNTIRVLRERLRRALPVNDNGTGHVAFLPRARCSGQASRSARFGSRTRLPIEFLLIRVAPIGS